MIQVAAAASTQALRLVAHDPDVACMLYFMIFSPPLAWIQGGPVRRSSQPPALMLSLTGKRDSSQVLAYSY